MRPKGEFSLNERVMEGSEENTVDGKPKSPLKQINRHSLRMKPSFAQVNGACSHDEALILKPNKAVVGSLIEYDIKPVKRCYEKATKDIVCQNAIETSRYSQSFTESSTKTYSRKKFSLDNHLVESFGLPDEPILDSKVRDKLDASVGESSKINLYSVNYLNSPWRISTLESDTLLDKSKEIRFKATPDVVQKKIKKIVTSSNNESSRESSGVDGGEMYTSTPNTTSKKIKVLGNKVIIRNLYKNEQCEDNGVKKGYKKVVFHNRNGVLKTRYFCDKKANLVKGEGSSNDKLVNCIKSDSNDGEHLVNSDNLVNFDLGDVSNCQFNIEVSINNDPENTNDKSENVINNENDKSKENNKETPTKRQRSLKKTHSENDLVDNVINNENDKSQENNKEESEEKTSRRHGGRKTNVLINNVINNENNNSQENIEETSRRHGSRKTNVLINNVINNPNDNSQENIEESEEETSRRHRGRKTNVLINNVINNANDNSQENIEETSRRHGGRKTNVLINNVINNSQENIEESKEETSRTHGSRKTNVLINNVINNANDNSQENIDESDEETSRKHGGRKTNVLINNVINNANDKSQENNKEELDKNTPITRRQKMLKKVNSQADLINNDVKSNNITNTANLEIVNDTSQENNKEFDGTTPTTRRQSLRKSDLINNVTNTANSTIENDTSQETQTTKKQKSLKKNSSQNLINNHLNENDKLEENSKGETINNVINTANPEIVNDASQENNKEFDGTTPTTRRQRKSDLINNVNSKEETNKIKRQKSPNNVTNTANSTIENDTSQETQTSKRQKSLKKNSSQNLINNHLNENDKLEENSKGETINNVINTSNPEIINDVSQENNKEEFDVTTPTTRQRSLKKTNNTKNDLINNKNSKEEIDKTTNRQRSPKNTNTTENYTIENGEKTVKTTESQNTDSKNANHTSQENSKKKLVKTQRQKSLKRTNSQDDLTNNVNLPIENDESNKATKRQKTKKIENDPPKRVLRSDNTFKSPEFLPKHNASYIEEIAQVLDLEVESSHSKTDDFFKVEDEDVVFTLSNSRRTSFLNKSKELSQNSSLGEKSSPKKFRSASLLSTEHQKLIEAVRSPSPRRNRSQSYNDSNNDENNLDRSKALTKSHEEHLHLLETIKAKGESFFVKDKRVNGDIDEESKKVIQQILMNDIILIGEPKRRLRSSEKHLKTDSMSLKENGITSEIRIMIKPMEHKNTDILNSSKEDKENYTSVNCQSNEDNEKVNLKALSEIPLTDGHPNITEELNESQVVTQKRKSMRLSKLGDSNAKNTDLDKTLTVNLERRRTRSKQNETQCNEPKEQAVKDLELNVDSAVKNRNRNGKRFTRSRERKDEAVKNTDLDKSERRRTRSKQNDLDHNETINSVLERTHTQSNEPKEEAVKNLDRNDDFASDENTVPDNETTKNRRKSSRLSKTVIDLTKSTKIVSNQATEEPIIVSSNTNKLTSLENNIDVDVTVDKPTEDSTIEASDPLKQSDTSQPEEIVILDSTIEGSDPLKEPDTPLNQSSPSSVKLLDNFKITIDLTKLTNQQNNGILVDLPVPLDIPDPLALDLPNEFTKEVTPSDLSELVASAEINLTKDGVTINPPASVDIENTDKENTDNVIPLRKSQRVAKVKESRVSRRSKRSICEQKVKYLYSSTDDDTDTDEDSLSLAKLAAQKKDEAGDKEKQETVAVKIKEELEDVKFDNVHYELHEIVWTRIGGYPFWPSLIVADPVRNEHVRQNPTNKLIEYHVRFFADNGRRAWCKSGNLMKYVDKDDLSVLREKLNRRIKKRKIAMSNVLEACIIKPHCLSKWQLAVGEAESLKDKSDEEKVAFFQKFCKEKPKTDDTDKKSKRKRESRVLAPRKKFKSLRDDEPRLSRVRRRRRSENESSDDNESKVSDSMEEALSIQAALFNRNKLFKKVGKEKVCQVCLKAGEVYKCKGRCGGVFHYQCALDFVGEDKKNGEKVEKKEETVNILVAADVHVEKVENQLVNISENVNMEIAEEHHNETTENVSVEVAENHHKEFVSNNVNMDGVEKHDKENATGDMKTDIAEDVTTTWLEAVKSMVPTESKEPKNLTTSQDNTTETPQNGEPVTPNSSLLEELQINCQKAVKQNGFVQIITIHSLINNTPPRKTFPPDYKNMSLAEQIDFKMKEIMKKFGDNARYASTTDSSIEEKVKNVSAEEIKENPVNPIYEEPKNEENPTEENVDKTVGEENQEREDEEVDKPRKKKKGRPLKRQSNELEEGIMHVTADAEIPSSPKLEEVFDSVNFKCGFCQENQIPFCNACNKAVSPSGSNSLQKCASGYCGKYYHQECLKIWPQTQWMLTQTVVKDDLVDAFQCPIHACHTCSSEDPRMAYLHRCSSDKLVRCLRCPASYHLSNFCVPAGTQILSQSQIICPRHIKQHKKTQVFNANWCFLCSETGTLVCCEFCPMSAHQKCLSKKYASDEDYICEDCQSGKMPLYDEIVWCKLGSYRWWPGVILYPNEIPDNIKKIPHNEGEFVVKFYGTYDHYWFSKGRVFQFADDDTAECSPHRQSIDIRFGRAVEEALNALKIKREFKQIRLKKQQRDDKPPPYIKLKVNKPVGNVRQFDPNLSNTAPCECNPKAAYPCGPDSDCLNRILLTECDPNVCPAGQRCCNQCFEKKQYPPLVPYKTESRGWGLKTLAPIKKGQFVIEYVGELIDEAEFDRRIKRMHESKDENYYFLIIEKDRMLDAGPKGNVARFMNHSCNPNCETQKWTINGETRVGLFASEPIPADTELTFNYNLQCVGEEKKVCMCGAPNCSGFIGAKIKRAPKKFKRKYKKKKKLVIPQTVQKLFCAICGKKDADQSCNNKICNKSYHLKCLKLDEKPTGKFICPWHRCNVCSRRTARCCIKCINSYCPQHSEDNIQYYPQTGFLCSEHCKDENTQRGTTKNTIPVDDSTTNTETSDDEDNISLNQAKKKKQESLEDENTSSESDSPTVNGKRGRRSSGNENRFRKKAKIVAHGTSKVTTSKKLRKKLSQSVNYSGSDKSTTSKRAKHRDTL